MTTELRKVLHHLCQEAGGFTDGQLLARFIATRDEAAFAQLVHRHGPMEALDKAMKKLREHLKR